MIVRFRGRRRCPIPAVPIPAVGFSGASPSSHTSNRDGGRFVIVDEDAWSDVHRADQHKTFLMPPSIAFELRGDVHQASAVGRWKLNSFR